ncbi:MAG: TIGR03435 family protein, partial [Candidatus Solibacter sp.]
SADQGPDPAAAGAAAPGGPSGGSGPAAFAPPPPPPPSANGPTTGFGPPGVGGAPVRLSVGADGQIKLPPGMGKGGMMMMMSAGRMHMVGNGQPVSALTEAISNQMGRPVMDETGLKAKYDFDLDFAPEGMMGPMGGMAPPPSQDGGGAIAGSPDGAGPSLTTALKEQLGLQLESKKGPVDMLIIDKVEKAPIEN